MAAPKRQAKLTDLPSTSEASTQPSDRDEGDDAVMPLTKKAKHRESGFDPAWKDEFTWIHVVEDHEGPGMVCSLCHKHNQTTKRMVWIEIPCRLFRKDKILQHQRSKCHMDSILTESHAAASRVSGGIRNALQEQISMQRMGVMSALKCLYWLVKEEIAHHTKFGSLLELAKSIGCPYLSELDVSKGAKYTSHMMIDDFLTVLSDCVETTVLSDVHNSSTVGILCDESTDIANLKQLVVFAKYLVAGLPQTRFLKVVSLQDGKAETIEQKLVEVCQTCKIPLTKIFGFGSDGASVMVGRSSGVATRLKKHNSEMISIHCGAHRLALASSQAAESIAYLKRFDNHLITLFYYFKNSPVREAALHQIQEIMEEPVLRLKRAVYTRWLSHDQAVTSIRRCLNSLLTALERAAAEDDAIARGLYNVMKTYKFVATLYLLSDVLPILTTLSLVFQKENVPLTAILPNVNATIASLNLLKTQPGLYLKKLDDILTDLASQFGLAFDDSIKKSFQENVREKYIDALVGNLNNRFSDIGVVNALASLLDPKKATQVYHASSESEFNTYGDSYVDTICKHFSVSVKPDTLKAEWITLKHVLVKDFHTTVEVMQTLASDDTLSSLYPSFSKLSSVALILPVSTADCERGFSTLKRIKTAPRNRLKTQTLDMLIRISSEGPEITKFNFDNAATVWGSKTNRKIHIQA